MGGAFVRNGGKTSNAYTILVRKAKGKGKNCQT